MLCGNSIFMLFGCFAALWAQKYNYFAHATNDGLSLLSFFDFTFKPN